MIREADNPKRTFPLLGAGTVAICAAVLLAIALVVPVPVKGRAVSSLMDLLHAPAFSLLAWLVCRGLAKLSGGRWLPRSLQGKLLVIAVPLAACGGVAELLQAFVGRGSSWHDARANLLGAVAGVCIFEISSRQRTRPRWRLWFATGLLFALASAHPFRILADYLQWRQEFPLLASFEKKQNLQWFAPESARLKRIQQFATDGQWALEIQLQPGKFPGIFLDGMPSDWSPYERLVFDLRVDEGPPLDLIVKVFDREHPGHNYDGNDRFDGHFRLSPGTHHIEISLAEVESAPMTRLMNMEQIEAWQLFTYDLTAPRTIVLDNLRLEE